MIRTCLNKYWDKELQQSFRCQGLRVYKTDGTFYCSMCKARKHKREMDRRFFPHKTNKDLILDISL